MEIDASKMTFSKMHIHRMRIPQKVSDLIDLRRYLLKVMKDHNSTLDKEKRYSRIILDWNPDRHHGFDAIVCYSRRKYVNSFGSYVSEISNTSKAALTARGVHYVFFLYRSIKMEQQGEKVSKAVQEAFALTTGDGNQLVKKWVEYDFPIKLAKVLMEPAISKRGTKSLAGNKDSTTEHYRLTFDLKKYELESMWLLFKEFSTNFLENSSLYNPDYGVSRFLEQKKIAKNEELKTNPKMAVSVGVGQINMGLKMTVGQHEELLIHFSRIVRGEKTLNCDKPKHEEKPSIEFSYLENIQVVDYGMRQKLDETIERSLYQLYKGEAALCDLYVVHRFYKDFYRSMEFIFNYNKKPIIIYSRPSLDDVLNIIKIYRSQMTLADFKNFLNECKLRFDARDKSFSLREFFQGEVRYLDGTYFRVDSLWLKVIPEHLVVIQRAFHSLISEHLISVQNNESSDENGQLPIPWFAKANWVSFSPESIPEEIDKNEFSETLKTLLDRKFRFVDTNGNVKCPYLVRCLLFGHEFGKSFSDSIKKKWEQIDELLLRKKNQKAKLNLEDLIALWDGNDNEKKQSKGKNAEKKGDDESITIKKKAENLMSLLQKEYPVLFRGKKIQVKKASIISENGLVIRNSLEGVHLPDTKVLESMRPLIEVFIKEKFTSQELVTKDEFVKELLKRKEDNNSFQKNRKKLESKGFLEAIYKNLKTKGIIQPNGELGKKSIENFEYPKNTPEIVKEKIKEFLEKGEKLNQKSFCEGVQSSLQNCEVKEIDGVGQARLEGVYNQLMKLHSLDREEVFGSEYLIQGPIPSEIEMSTPIREFLQQQHENYKLVVQEEGYNRMYLQKPNYLVCDQVYAGKRESGELFDIAYDCPGDGTLYLYHVKESFGQKTSEACAQILSAAVSLRGAIDEGGYKAVRSLYNRSVSGGSSTPFRRQLKEKMRALPLPEGSTEESDRLVHLFSNKNRKNICFVYAFIDDAEDERLLVNELSPSYEFSTHDFEGFVGQEQIIDLLKNPSEKKSYINEKNQVGGDLLRDTKEIFLKEMKSRNRDIKWDKVYQILTSHISQFDSMRAKIELLQLEIFMKDLRFGFKICQIPRSPHGFRNANNQFQPTVISEPSDYVEDFLYHSVSDGEEDAPSIDEIQHLINNPPNIIGMENIMGVDCFFNALFQVLVRSPFRRVLPNLFDKKRKENSEEIDEENIEKYTKFIAALINKFYQSVEENVAYSRDNMRQLLGFGGKRDIDAQQDADECFTRMIAHFDTDPEGSLFCFYKQVREGTYNGKLHPSNYSPEVFPVLKLPLDEGKENSFQNLLNAHFTSKEQGGGDYIWKPTIDGEEVEISRWKERAKISTYGEIILIQLIRFEFDNSTGKKSKRSDKISWSSIEVVVDEEIYKLRGFVEHLGPSIDAGHYVSYSLTEQGWYFFNDATVPVKKNEGNEESDRF